MTFKLFLVAQVFTGLERDNDLQKLQNSSSLHPSKDIKNQTLKSSFH